MAKNQHRPNWTNEQLAQALEEVKSGAPKRKTAEKYGIPWGTLSDKLSGRRKMEVHVKTILSETEEQELVNYLKEMSIRGFGKTKDEFLLVVKNFLDQNERETKWQNNVPSSKWFRLFRQRHKEIVFRKPQLLGKQRALITKQDILEWFNAFTKAIKDIDPSILLEPERMYNLDESGFALNAVSGRILSCVGNKFPYQVGSEAKTMITTLVCCSATNHYTSPMLIYPGTQFRGFKPHEVFEASFIAKSKNGWTNQDLFCEWLRLVFVPQTSNIKKPLLLLADGHISHQSLQASKICADNGIVLYCLPPHSSHIMQPLDVGIFKTMKAEWKAAVKRQNETEIVTKRTFAKTFKDAYEKTVVKPLAENAFRACGLFPLDPNNIDWSKVLPTTGTTNNATPAKETESYLSTSALSSTPTSSGTPALETATYPRTSTLSSTPTPSEIFAEETAAYSPISTLSSITASGGTPATETETHPPVSTHSIPQAKTGSELDNPSYNSCRAGRSLDSDVSTDSVSTLRKFSMICSQIGDSTLNLYYTRLEEGYDCEDSLYSLWKSYYNEIVSKISTPKLTTERPVSVTDIETTSTQNPEMHALAIPQLKKGTKRMKSMKLPPLISSSDFRQMLIQKETEQQNEEERKKQRKIDMEEKRKAKAIEEERKKASREQKRKEIEERKRKKELESQLRKEERKRKREERLEMKAKGRLGQGKKNRKVSRKLYDSDTDTSVDERAMVLDDNSSDEYHLSDSGDYCEDEHDKVNDAEGQEGSRSIPEAIQRPMTTENQNIDNDTTDMHNPNDSLTCLTAVNVLDMNESLYQTPSRNLWSELGADSLQFISPTNFHTDQALE